MSFYLDWNWIEILYDIKSDVIKYLFKSVVYSLKDNTYKYYYT